jgi:hypothetical protein
MAPDATTIAISVVRGSQTRRQRDDLERVVISALTTLNGGQDLFYFRLAGVDVLEGQDTDERRGYSLDQYFDALSATMTSLQSEYAIAVSAEVLTSGSFNREDPSRNCGVVSTHNYAQYRPAGVSLTSYLCYLLVCVALTLGYAIDEHPKRGEFCLFDLCIEQEDFRKCLRHPHICEVDKDKLIDRVYQDSFDKLAALLRDIGRREPYELITGQEGAAATTFLVGIVLALVTNEVTSEWPRSGLVIIWILAVCVLWLLLSRALRNWSWAASHRSLVWRISNSILLALLALGVVFGGVVRWPHLPTDSNNGSATHSNESPRGRGPTSSP